MNTKQLLVAVLSMTIAASTFADQNLTRVHSDATRSDLSAAKQSAQAVSTPTADKPAAPGTHSPHGQQAGE